MSRRHRRGRRVRRSSQGCAERHGTVHGWRSTLIAERPRDDHDARRGAHVTLPGYFAPSSCGLIVPKTKDGRVVFMIPWLGSVIAGTTDTVAPVTLRPARRRRRWISSSTRSRRTCPSRRRVATSSPRGLASDRSPPIPPRAARRTSVAITSWWTRGPGMIRDGEGRAGTYRLMAEHAVDAVIAVGGEEMKSRASACRTDDVAVVGAHGFRRDLPAVLLSGASGSARGEIDERRPAGLSQNVPSERGDRRRNDGVTPRASVRRSRGVGDGAGGERRATGGTTRARSRRRRGRRWRMRREGNTARRRAIFWPGDRGWRSSTSTPQRRRSRR